MTDTPLVRYPHLKLLGLAVYRCASAHGFTCLGRPNRIAAESGPPLAVS